MNSPIDPPRFGPPEWKKWAKEVARVLSRMSPTAGAGSTVSSSRNGSSTNVDRGSSGTEGSNGGGGSPIPAPPSSGKFILGSDGGVYVWIAQDEDCEAS